LLHQPTLCIAAIIEGLEVSGPAKNLFQFCRSARTFTTGPLADVRVITFQRLRNVLGSRQPDWNCDLLDAATEAGIPVSRITERFVYDMTVLKRLRELHQTIKPDVIETHAPKSHFLVRLSGIWRHTAWIAFHHGYTDTDIRSPIYNNLDRWSLHAATRIVTMNRAFHKDLVQRGARKERILVLHNAISPPKQVQIPVNPEILAEKKRAIGFLAEEKLILCAGRLSREKAQVNLVMAMARLRHTHPGLAARLIIAGDGPERSKLSKAVRSLGMETQVALIGYRKSLIPYYEAADVVAIPSRSEGSPNVLLEAMAWGVPVVATGVGGIPEMVVHGESALLVQPGDPNALAAAIGLILSVPELATSLATQARKKVEKDYSLEARANSLLDIYASSISSRTRLGTIGRSP
jgi:glycosyltransferase involved in cell wall biosynthesis